MTLITGSKEQAPQLFHDASFPKALNLSEIIAGYTNPNFPPAPPIKPFKDFSGDTSIVIDNREQIVTEIKVTGGLVTQIMQRRAFVHGSSRFEFCFKMLPKDDKNGQEVVQGVLYRFTLEPLDRKLTPPRLLMHYGYQKDQPFTGILIRKGAIKEEQFGLPRCPDALDLRDVLTNVFAGEFTLAGIWDPEGEIEKR